MLADIRDKAQELFSENASTILTAGGVLGTVTTAVLAARAGMKATQVIADEAKDHPDAQAPINDDANFPFDFVDTKTKVKLVWPLFVPPAVTGAATVSAIIFANRINAKNAAAWAAAYAASAKQRDEYKAKLEEKLGMRKSEEARAEMAKERMEKSDARTEMIIVSGGSVLCYDGFSDRYIRTTAEKIRQAEKKCREVVGLTGECELRVFYNELGFDPVQWDDMLGWNDGNPPSVTIDTTLVNDEPCLAIELNHLPMPDFSRRNDYP